MIFLTTVCLQQFQFVYRVMVQVTPKMLRRRKLRELFGEFDTQLDLFKFCSTLDARNNVFGKLLRLLAREFSMTIS